MITATSFVKRMRGGAQAQLLNCSEDGQPVGPYVVKFQNNPQDVRVLANDYISTRLARIIGLTVPDVAIVDVPQSVIEEFGIALILGGSSLIPMMPGLQFGSRYREGYEYLPVEMFDRVSNVREFCGILALDKWTGNADGRQVLFSRSGEGYCAMFIDQGYCFNAAEWTFPDYPMRGAFSYNQVYEGVQGWEAFEPWLSRIAAITSEQIWEIAHEVPVEWYEKDAAGLQKLVQNLFDRRGKVEELIQQFGLSPRRPFQNWDKINRA